MASRRFWMAVLGLLVLGGGITGSAWWRSPNVTETHEELFVDEGPAGASPTDVTLGAAAPEPLPLLPPMSVVAPADPQGARPALDVPPWPGATPPAGPALAANWARFEQPQAPLPALSTTQTAAESLSSGGDAVWLDGTIETFDDVPLWPGGSAFMPAARPDAVAP